jgi:hypothetical protein
MRKQLGSSTKTPESSRSTELFIHAGLRGVYYRLRSRYYVLPSDYRVALRSAALAVRRGVNVDQLAATWDYDEDEAA